MSTDWSMPRRAEVCAACQHPFEVGESHLAAIYDCPTGYERTDVCLDCPADASRTPLATWRSRRPAPSHPRSQPFDRQAIFGFFERLESSTSPQQIQFRFLLGLLLWRKKVLRLDTSSTNGAQESWEYVLVGQDRRFTVIRPDLDEAQLEDLSAQLESVLAGGDAETLDPAVTAAIPGTTESE